MWFSFGRSEGFPTQYAPARWPVTVDVLELGIIISFVMVFVAFCTSLLKNNASRTIISLTYMTVSLLIGLLLLLQNFGQEWEVSHITSKTPYKAGSSHEIIANLGVKIGLRSVNVTLQSDTSQIKELQYETIDYNERFEWTWDQGRFGFGPYAGLLQRQFRAAQYRGLPTPILWIVDYFVIDGEGFRFGRFYRTAGWYCHILLWTAFATWLVSNILIRSVIYYGAYMLAITGTLQLATNLVWLVVRNPNDLIIPFEDDTIRTKFGSSFWLTFVNGVFCLVTSIAMTIMYKYCENTLYAIFDVDPLKFLVDVAYLTKNEAKLLRPKTRRKADDQIPFVEMPMQEMGESSQQSAVVEPEEPKPVYFKRNTFKAPPVNRNMKPSRFKM